MTKEELNYVINCKYRLKGQSLWSEGPVIKLSSLKEICPKKYKCHLSVLEYFYEHKEIFDKCKKYGQYMQMDNQLLVKPKTGYYIRFTWLDNDIQIQYWVYGTKMANFGGISNDKLVSIIFEDINND